MIFILIFPLMFREKRFFFLFASLLFFAFPIIKANIYKTAARLESYN